MSTLDTLNKSEEQLFKNEVTAMVISGKKFGALYKAHKKKPKKKMTFFRKATIKKTTVKKMTSQSNHNLIRLQETQRLHMETHHGHMAMHHNV